MNSVAWSSILNLFVSVSDDSSIKIWRTDGQPLSLSPTKPTEKKIKINRRLTIEVGDSDEQMDDFNSQQSDEYISEDEEEEQASWN